MSNIKICNNIEHFEELIEIIKISNLKLYINGLKIIKRKNLIEDFNNIFDNNILVEYRFILDRLEIYVNQNITKKSDKIKTKDESIDANSTNLNETIKFAINNILKPTMRLRYKLKEIKTPKEHFVETKKEWILQQLWISNSDEIEWRDVEKVL